MISIGQTTTERIQALGYTEKLTGKVIWIHPDKRFYRVRFDFKNGSFVEAFPMTKYEEDQQFESKRIR